MYKNNNFVSVINKILPIIKIYLVISKKKQYICGVKIHKSKFYTIQIRKNLHLCTQIDNYLINIM